MDSLAEVIRLRAEVEEWRTKALDVEHHPAIVALRRERDEALAQVAVQLQAWIGSWDCSADPGHGVMAQAIDNLPDKAHALLDRLRRAEAVVEAAKPLQELYDTVNRGWPFDMTKHAKKLFKALAAWEEGKT